MLHDGEGFGLLVGERVEVMGGVIGLEVAHGSECGEFGAHGVGAVEVGPFECHAEFFPFCVGAFPNLLGGNSFEGEDSGEFVGGVVGGGVEVVDEFGALERVLVGAVGGFFHAEGVDVGVACLMFLDGQVAVLDDGIGEFQVFCALVGGAEVGDEVV